MKRIIHLASFALTSGLGLLTKLFTKPDVIFLVQPTLFCAPGALLFAKLTGAKAVMHIQDFEVDAMLGLGMASNGRIGRIARSVERWLLRRFDAVSTISNSMLENAKQKGVSAEKLFLFPNWSDTEFVTPHSNGDGLRAEWGFSTSDKIILYAGNIGQKQGLEVILEAATAFENQPAVKFVLVGTGAYAEALLGQAQAMALSNVYFMPLQPWSRVPEMLALADVHLVIQKKGAADAVLPSKLTNILSAGGHAIVTAEQNTELGQIAARHSGIYSLVEPENPQAFITCLQQVLGSDITSYNVIAREYAEQFLNKEQILNQFVQDLENIVMG